jgi:hypothetical protein
MAIKELLWAERLKVLGEEQIGACKKGADIAVGPIITRNKRETWKCINNGE